MIHKRNNLLLIIILESNSRLTSHCWRPTIQVYVPTQHMLVTHIHTKIERDNKQPSTSLSLLAIFFSFVSNPSSFSTSPAHCLSPDPQPCTGRRSHQWAIPRALRSPSHIFQLVFFFLLLYGYLACNSTLCFFFFLLCFAFFMVVEFALLTAISFFLQFRWAFDTGTMEIITWSLDPIRRG